MLEPPPPPPPGPADAGPGTTRDGGVAESEFETQLYAASAPVTHLLTFDLADPASVTDLVPPRPQEYGLPAGAFLEPYVTPDGNGLVYFYFGTEGERIVVWLDPTVAQDAPRIVHESMDVTFQVLALSNEHVAIQVDDGVVIAPLDGSGETRSPTSDRVRSATFVDAYVVLVHEGVEPHVTSHALNSADAIELIDRATANNPSVVGVSGDRVLISDFDGLFAFDPATGDGTLVAEFPGCTQLLGTTPDGAEFVCRVQGVGGARVLAYRLDGTTATSPRLLLGALDSAILSADGRWLWSLAANRLAIIDASTGNVAATSTVGDYDFVDDVTDDGRYATLRGDFAGAIFERESGPVFETERHLTGFDVTDRFVPFTDNEFVRAYELATGVTHTLPFLPTAYTAAGAHARVQGGGMRLFRADGIDDVEAATDWFLNTSTLIAHDDHVVTSRGFGGTWKTPRVAGESTLLAKRRDSAAALVVGDRLVTTYPTDDFSEVEAESYAFDGRDADAAPESWRLPDRLLAAGSHLVAYNLEEIVTVEVDGIQDEPRELFTSADPIRVKAWVPAIERLLVTVEDATSERLLALALDGEVVELAVFEKGEGPFLDVHLQLDDTYAYVTLHPRPGTWRVTLDGSSAPVHLSEVGRLERVFPGPRRGVILGTGFASLLDLDTGATESITSSTSQFEVSVSKSAGDGFAFRDEGRLAVARRLDPLQIVEVATDGRAIAFTPDDSGLYHFISGDDRLHRYDFELGWSRTLTDDATDVREVYPVRAQYPIVRAFVDGEVGVFALLDDGRLRPVLDLPNASEFHVPTALPD